jgi:hypothetical protein
LISAVEHIDALLTWAEEEAAAPVEERTRHDQPTGRAPGRQPRYNWARGKKLYEQGIKVAAIADALGCSTSAVKGHKQRHGWMRKPSHLTRDEPVAAVLCPDCEHETTKNPCEHCHQFLPTMTAKMLE